MTNLLTAVVANDLAKVKFLLADKNIDINEKNEQEETALFIAVKLGLNEITELLLASKANINCRDKNYKGLIDIALEKGNDKAFELLSNTKHWQEMINDWINWNALITDKLLRFEKGRIAEAKCRLQQRSLFEVSLNNSKIDAIIKAPAYYNEACTLLELFGIIALQMEGNDNFASLSAEAYNERLFTKMPLLRQLNALPNQIAEENKRYVYREIYRMTKVLVSDALPEVKLKAIQQFENAVKSHPTLWDKSKQVLTILICGAVGVALGIAIVGGLGICMGVWASPFAVAAALYSLTTTASITSWVAALIVAPVTLGIMAGVASKFCFFKPSVTQKLAVDIKDFVRAIPQPKV